MLDNTPLTIRQAKWVSRLFYVLKDKDIGWLLFWAKNYAYWEQALELTGDYPTELKDMWDLWQNDISLLGHFDKATHGILFPKYMEATEAERQALLRKVHSGDAPPEDAPPEFVLTDEQRKEFTKEEIEVLKRGGRVEKKLPAGPNPSLDDVIKAVSKKKSQAAKRKLLDDILMERHKDDS
jgi:hypothetical protein